VSQMRPVEPALTVNVLGYDQLPDQGTGRPRRHRNLPAVAQLEDLEGVDGGLVKGAVAGDRRNAEQFDLGTCQSQENGNGVVVPGIAVDDDRDANKRIMSREREVHWASASLGNKRIDLRPGRH
jgi:hypothetical protein